MVIRMKVCGIRMPRLVSTFGVNIWCHTQLEFDGDSETSWPSSNVICEETARTSKSDA